MVKKTLPVSGNVSFEELKKENEHGAEFWSARELQPLLGYSQWRRFEDAVLLRSVYESQAAPDWQPALQIFPAGGLELQNISVHYRPISL